MWDKYRVSLHQLDDELQQVEQMMNNYLLELGHE